MSCFCFFRLPPLRVPAVLTRKVQANVNACTVFVPIEGRARCDASGPSAQVALFLAGAFMFHIFCQAPFDFY